MRKRIELKKKGATILDYTAANYSHRTALRFFFFVYLPKKRMVIHLFFIFGGYYEHNDRGKARYRYKGGYLR